MPSNKRYSRAQHKFDFAELERQIRDPDHSDVEFAAAIGITRDKARLYRRKGIPFYEADALCIRLGFHPSLIWGEEYWNPPRHMLERNQPKQEAQ